MTLLNTPAIRNIPEATVARLPVYLRALATLADQGLSICSSNDLATAAGVNPAKLRKDLSYLGSYGTRGVGYDIEYLRYHVARALGPDAGLGRRHRGRRPARLGAVRLQRLQFARHPHRGARRQ